ncbi:MAG: hypothetical protein WD872_17910 [Pirellulaceae bacterium]
MERFRQTVESPSTILAPIDYVSWFVRLLNWDLLLTTFVAVAPTIVALLLPGKRGAIEIVAVALPIIAFFLRARAGIYHIGTNNCGTSVRRFQRAAFALGIFLLVFFDAVMILSHIMPRGAFGLTDYIASAILFSVYITAMAVAMYPGRMKPLIEL